MTALNCPYPWLCGRRVPVLRVIGSPLALRLSAGVSARVAAIVYCIWSPASRIERADVETQDNAERCRRERIPGCGRTSAVTGGCQATPSPHARCDRRAVEDVGSEHRWVRKVPVSIRQRSRGRLTAGGLLPPQAEPSHLHHAGVLRLR